MIQQPTSCRVLAIWQLNLGVFECGISVRHCCIIFQSRAEGAFMPDLIGIEWINRAFKEGASRLARSKSFRLGQQLCGIGQGAPDLPARSIK
jgi:hypothetical protein